MSQNLPDFLHGKPSSAPWGQTSELPLLSSRLSPSWAQDSRRSWYCSWKIPTCYPWCRALFVGGHSLSEVPWAGLEGLTWCYLLPASTWKGPGGGDDGCVCVYVCVFTVLDIVNILDLFLPFVVIHTVPSLGLFIPSHTSVLLRLSLVWKLPLDVTQKCCCWIFFLLLFCRFGLFESFFFGLHFS